MYGYTDWNLSPWILQWTVAFQYKMLRRRKYVTLHRNIKIIKAAEMQHISWSYPQFPPYFISLSTLKDFPFFFVWSASIFEACPLVTMFNICSGILCVISLFPYVICLVNILTILFTSCVGLTTLPPSCADCLETWEPQPAGTLWACPGL